MRIGAVAALALLGVLCGCGSDVDESGSVSPEAGVDGQVGKVDLRDVFVLGGDNGADLPAGGSAPVYLTLVNQPAGGETNGTSGTQAEDDVLQSVTSPAAASTEIVGGPVNLPAGQDVRIGPDAKIILRNLTAALPSGGNIELTFTFQKAGTGTVSVPVQERQESLNTYSPAP
ncbi:copper chaperone PCu(A)C [Actinocorallia sp. A-T 12471]|uniref:copper chaperone PCu(A)C n=1 Tax=Actinocorallia sp. A-T 12471 TaxID=3089813 RepID=UPI0029CEBF6A|nr:copper chaperone PCu(A)C [Actinocorallia sp. A-T 12471]MDX6744808.1 copper chaperone PCu(A)C [Actinocorallia sp. A-T 12471]